MSDREEAIKNLKAGSTLDKISKLDKIDTGPSTMDKINSKNAKDDGSIPTIKGQRKTTDKIQDLNTKKSGRYGKSKEVANIAKSNTALRGVMHKVNNEDMYEGEKKNK